MKSYKYIYIFFAIAIFLQACVVEDGENPYYPPTAYGVYPIISDVQNGFFDIVDPSTAEIAFTIAPSESGGAESNGSGEIQINFNGGDYINYANVNSFPHTETVTLNEAAAATGVNVSSLTLDDSFSFRFYFQLVDGQEMTSGNVLNVPMNCASTLAGTHTYVSTNLQATNGFPCPTGEVTGTVTFTDIGGGNYLVSDLGFGQYSSSCWDDSPATSSNAIFSDSCGKIISGGQDQYSLTYIWVITQVDGPDLYLSWTNDYGDSGNTVITREGGQDWPPLFTD
ncbi:hypothetical protein [Aegicerativicinus sediminis]|uniref:hypothetical protein n=1 Tax=Aegicerativicinus sediminis TaxID=2893202 RepID=UPI001E4D6E7A|nr:hypothetical protein [Aegicerativicinus sediminis]